MTWAADLAEMATTILEGFGRAQAVDIDAFEVDGETVDATAGTVTTNGGGRITAISGWREDDLPRRAPSGEGSTIVGETTWRFRMADIDVTTYGQPQQGWEIIDSTLQTRTPGAVWRVTDVAYECEGAILALACVRKR